MRTDLIELSRFFGTTPGFWMNLQGRYDLERLMEEKGEELGMVIPSTGQWERQLSFSD